MVAECAVSGKGQSGGASGGPDGGGWGRGDNLGESGRSFVQGDQGVFQGGWIYYFMVGFTVFHFSYAWSC